VYAFWTPFPPTRSGTADYALALVTLLAKEHPITVIVEDSQYTAESRDLATRVGAHLLPERDYRYLAPHVALDVYFLANNQHHVYMYRRAEAHPGLLVLHENAANGGYFLLIDRELRERPELAAARFQAEVRRVYPEYPHVLSRYRLENAPFMASMTERLIEASTGVLVHNPVLAKRLQVETGADVAYAPLPRMPEMPAQDVAQAWEGLLPKLPDRPVLFGSLGFASSYKRLPQTLRAYRRFAREQPQLASRTAFVVAGQMDAGTRAALAAEKAVEGLGAGHWLELPYLTEPALEALLTRLDLLVNLRFPSFGEASAMLSRSLSFGKATVVSDIGFYGSMPDDVVLKVDPLDGEEDALARLFARCARGEPLLDTERIKRFASNAFDPDVLARNFGACLEKNRERQIRRL